MQAPPQQTGLLPAPYTGEGIPQLAPPGPATNRLPVHQRLHEPRHQPVILVPVVGTVVLDAYGRPMQAVYEPGKVANWIAPPDRGINNQPVDYEYVRV